MKPYILPILMGLIVTGYFIAGVRLNRVNDRLIAAQRTLIDALNKEVEAKDHQILAQDELISEQRKMIHFLEVKNGRSSQGQQRPN